MIGLKKRDIKNCLIEHGNMKLLPGVAIYGKNGGGKVMMIAADTIAREAYRNTNNNTAAPAGGKFCTQCGKSMPAEALFCSGCGAKL